MNKQPISIQPSSTSDTRAALSDAGTKSELNLSTQTFTARNIVIKPNSLQMEVELNGRWQPLRLAINNGNTVPIRIEEALITIHNNGQSLTLKTPEQNVQIKAANALLSLLTLLKNQHPSTNIQHHVSVTEKPHPQLHFNKLGMSLSINPVLAQVLKNESKLVAGIQADAHKISFTLFNQFEDKLLAGTISKHKVIDSLSAQKQMPLMLVDKQSVQIKFTESQQPLKLSDALVNAQPSKAGNKWFPVEISKQTQGVKLSQVPQSHLLALSHPVKRQFSDVTTQPTTTIQNVDSVRLETTLNYTKPLLNISLDDIKLAVKTALIKWATLPFSGPNNPKLTSATPKSTATFTPQLINQVGRPMVLQSAQHPAQPPIVQLLSQLTQVLQDPILAKSSLSDKEVGQTNPTLLKVLTSPLIAVQETNLSANTPRQKPLSEAPYVPKRPIERLLLSTLLAVKPSNQSNTAVNSDISPKIEALFNYRNSNSIDLTRLVNNAFSRMISEENTNSEKVLQELQPQLGQLLSSQPKTTIKATAANFTQALDKLLVTLIAAPKAVQGYSEDAKLERLHTLLKTLTPEFKSVQPKQMLQNLPLLQSQLVDDLIQVNNASHVNLPANPNAAKFDSDTQLLLSLFLPMKLPSECKQTELQIGQYKRKAKENMPEKTVWFIRLNFDYANQGKISAHAELMDKSLDIQLLASTVQARQLAAPHIDGLRRKLSEHGLQVSEIALSENAEQVELFFNSHSIVNIQI
ncbi:flagellar hook-length control protein FliK [Pseudoalteromonas aurantia]|uniref:Flagellar hook-length control protein-like C-terminal domain-containing protein n=1 Tax=Pseudoalteromonas aurantia TaxID=43654 RepID=A0ABY2VXI8_9GAMM|nr:flagellar hook-length control protein FliK [Pseudoalteromonas aurantia]TMO63302.1 hypothetical protein CWC18_08720 [Pseudoalteromonas aurantia]TMO74379.1 hypothetical protein CWC20_10595 [Pseudoalteromonas aurantia]